MVYEVKRKLLHRLLSPLTNYVEHRKYPGWSGFLPFYRIKCPRHGEQITYPHGFRKTLVCLECLKEAGFTRPLQGG